VRFEVFLSDDAEQDIEDIVRYIAEQDSRASVDRVLTALEAACRRLGSLALRGAVPKELRALGIAEFRQVHSGPYRIIYRIMGPQVVVYCVLEGRRDMPSLLHRRLVR
jgi:toxin ParE1/3/4